MIQHTFTLKLNTPDNITKAMIVDDLAQALGWTAQDGAKGQFVQKKVGEYLIDKMRSVRLATKIRDAQTQAGVELQEVTAE